MNKKTWTFLAALALAPTAMAERFVIDATGAGTITGDGRDLQFDLSAITDPIESAQMVIDLQYDDARELGIRLIDGSGFVELPVVPRGALTEDGKQLEGQYRFTDDAVTTWTLASMGTNLIPARFPYRAWQPGTGGECRNLLGRFLEFDINRAAPLTLRIDRTVSGNPGGGSVAAARLLVDTGIADEIMATGFDEPDAAMGRCRPPQLNVVLNGQHESPVRSTFTVVHRTGGDQPLQWYVRDFVNPDVGPIAFGEGSDQEYVGRFGGRNRLNLGFWSADSGTVTFTTGAGARTITLPPFPGNPWPSLFHRVIPGDYDGDGVTDVALVFLDPIINHWVATIRYSSNGRIHPFIIDPRQFQPELFQSSRIGFGAGQDADQNGVDELTVFAESNSGNMYMIQFVIEGQALATAFLTRWGALGDRMVLGKWQPATTGNQFGLMVVRPPTAVLDGQWFVFPNVTPQSWGITGDQPVSINRDGDALNDIAVYRPADRRLYVIDSATGQQQVLDPLGGVGGFNAALGNVQGTIAPVDQ